MADPREPGVETVEAGREGISHDFAGDFSCSEVECVGERPVQVLREPKRRGQPLDEKVLSLGRDDAVRVDAVLETCLEQPLQELQALAPEGHEVEFRHAIFDLFHRSKPSRISRSAAFTWSALKSGSTRHPPLAEGVEAPAAGRG